MDSKGQINEQRLLSVHVLDVQGSGSVSASLNPLNS